MKKKKEIIDTEMSVNPVHGQPETVSEQLRKYGTYEIQPTNDSDSDYPAIAQGLPEDN